MNSCFSLKLDDLVSKIIETAYINDTLLNKECVRRYILKLIWNNTFKFAFHGMSIFDGYILSKDGYMFHNSAHLIWDSVDHKLVTPKVKTMVDIFTLSIKNLDIVTAFSASAIVSVPVDWFSFNEMRKNNALLTFV